MGRLLMRFPSEPPLGTRLLLDAQAYELIGVEPYTRKSDGLPSRLLRWESHCPEAGCGAAFNITTGLSVTHCNRRCPEHLSGLKPVTGGRGRQVEVRVELP